MEKKEEKIERDIIKNSKYIIAFYKEKGKELTNLKLQKLCYFLEAVYMVISDDDHLYEDDFSAWNFGPVNSKLYQEYKNFGRLRIVLENDVEINEENRKYINSLYELFKGFDATALVSLSHAEGSPWYKIYKENGDDIPKNAIIDKKETKKWFKGLVTVQD